VVSGRIPANDQPQRYCQLAIGVDDESLRGCKEGCRQQGCDQIAGCAPTQLCEAAVHDLAVVPDRCYENVRRFVVPSSSVTRALDDLIAD
jgi:hypothetical protein